MERPHAFPDNGASESHGILWNHFHTHGMHYLERKGQRPPLATRDNLCVALTRSFVTGYGDGGRFTAALARRLLLMQVALVVADAPRQIVKDNRILAVSWGGPFVVFCEGVR